MSIKFVHRYLGLALCLIMLSISVTGVALVWKKEFLWLTVEGAREVVDTSLLPIAIGNIEALYKPDEVTFIQLHSEDLSIHKVFLSGRRYAWHNQRGDKIQEWSDNDRWEDFILDLHHRFLLGNTIGLNIAGFGGLLLLPLIVLGIIIWWPRRRFLSVGVLPRSLERAEVLRSHSNIGGVFALPILVLAVTGVILVYPAESRTLLAESIGQGGPDKTTNERFDADNGLLSWASLIQITRQKFPESHIRSVQPSSSKAIKGTVKRSVNIQQQNGWHRLGRTSLKFYSDGELVIKDEFKQSTAKRMLGFSYPLHTAKLGLLYRIVVTLVGMAFMLLCAFGFMSYLKRNVKK